MNRVLLIVVIVLSLALGAAIGYIVAYQQIPEAGQLPSQQPKYSQQEIAAMKVELQRIETKLGNNERWQESLEDWMTQAWSSGWVIPSYSMGQDVGRALSDLFELQDEHQRLFEQKILLKAQLEAVK